MDDDEHPAPVIGTAESGEGHEHSAWLYLPDLESRTGWVNHQVPKGDQRSDKRMGFRALHDRERTR